MMNPPLIQQKVIRMLTPQHIIRATQMMTGSSTHAHNEANNNHLTSNNTEKRRYGDSGIYRNYNELGSMDRNIDDRTSIPPSDWSTDQMYWNGEGDMPDCSELDRLAQQNSASIMSFHSNMTNSSTSASYHSQISEQSESKEEEISLILNKIRSQNKVDASKMLLNISSSVENCIAMRHCGCLPLLVQLLHCADDNCNTYHMVHAKRINFEVRERASQVLHNIVFSQSDDKKSRREARVLRLLEQIRDYCDQLRNVDGDNDNMNARSVEQQLGTSVASLMKLSFDEDHRYAMCQLGGLQAIAELLQMDQEAHGCTNDQYCITIRRYAGMVLTNLTFGDGANKALLCSMRPFMESLVAQLYSPSEDLRQVTASVLRNLSWRADPASKRILREVGAVTMLVKAAMEAEKESTLKSILSALWNLSAHCSGNKADICHVSGALAFLVGTLTYKSKSKTLAIVENGGGILRNVSSHIAIQNDYRIILRKHNCLQILLQHLKSPSLTVVSNACGTLWNLSARNAMDQRTLWEMGAVGMLKKLINSKHKMISMGSSAALKNLLSAKPPGVGLCVYGENYKGSDDAPSLMVRKQKALNTEIDQNLSETYEITDSPKTSPVKQADKQNRSRRHISPSARYMTNQKLRNELSLPSRNADSLNSSIVVEEKHNGAFQVTKNAKQAMSYKQSQQDSAQAVSQVDRKSAESAYESSRLGCASKKGDKHSFSSVNRPKPDAKNSSIPYSCKNETPSHLAKTTSHEDPHEKAPLQKLLPESKIPLPKSFNSQRSQSASPVAQRRPQRQQDISQVARNVDVTVTQPKYAWSSNFEKKDNEPEQLVSLDKSLGREDNPNARPLEDDYSSEDEVRVYRTENTPSNSSLAANDLEEVAASARCSLNIKTSTNVRMIKNHPLLVNSSVCRGEEDRLFEHRTKHEHFGEEGKTVDFSMQSDYDIDETLSMMSRSSSMVSISSFDQQSFHEDESFASDLSHRTSGIESPSELSDSPCEPSSPVKPMLRASDELRMMDTERECEEEQPNDSCKDQEVNGASLCVQQTADQQMVTKDSPTAKSASAICGGDHSKMSSRESRSNISSSAEDMSPSDKLMLEECIRAGMPDPCCGARQKTHQSIPVERHPKTHGYDGGRTKFKNLVVKDTEYDNFSENEEKGKEDERKAEKTRLFRIPESPVEKKLHGIMDSNKTGYLRDDRSTEAPDVTSVKIAVDRKGNRRFEKSQQMSKPEGVKSIPNQLSFLMNRQKNIALDILVNKIERANSPEDVSCISRLDETENQELSLNTEDSDNSYFTCYSEARSSDKDGSRKTLKSSESGDYFKLSDSSKDSKPRSPEELSEKDIDCSERDDDDDTMIKSSILDEAKEIAQALLGARVDSTEDMTVSTLSCLSDIDNARPPSVMAEIGCLSLNSSNSTSEENLKLAVTRECQKLFGAKQIKKSLLRELQIGRLTSDPGSNDNSKCSNESASMRSSSELLGNVNPPSMLEDMSLTGSLEGSDSECERHLVDRFRNKQDSMSERMHDAAAISKLYAKELYNITGDTATEANSDEVIPQMCVPPASEVVEVTIADVTDIGCDTIGSDTELEDDLPCDDEELGSETLQAPSLKKGDGSIENLTVTLTEEPPKQQISPYLNFQKQSVCFMTADQLRALQENADMILNTLKDVEISDEETAEGMSNGDMLDDETMSLVSNESDEEFLSPDGQNHQRQKTSPRSDFLLSPICNGMVGLPQSTSKASSKYAIRKSSLPQFSPRKKPALAKHNEQSPKNRYSYPELTGKEQSIDFGRFEDRHHQKNSFPMQSNEDDGQFSETRASQAVTKSGPNISTNQLHNHSESDESFENGVFDSRTFTRKRTSIPREMIPSVCSMNQRGTLKSPSATNLPSLPSSPKIKTEPSKTITSKIAGVWKNSGKVRSKSAADTNRSSKLQVASVNNNTCKDENRNGWTPTQRSSSETPSPKSPLSRSSTFEKLNEEAPSSARRPNSLALGTNSLRHAKGVPQRCTLNKQGNEEALLNQASEDTMKQPPGAILSPQGGSIPKNKAQVILIPGRRSMIPTPASQKIDR